MNKQIATVKEKYISWSWVWSAIESGWKLYLKWFIIYHRVLKNPYMFYKFILLNFKIFKCIKINFTSQMSKKSVYSIISSDLKKKEYLVTLYRINKRKFSNMYLDMLYVNNINLTQTSKYIFHSMNFISWFILSLFKYISVSASSKPQYDNIHDPIVIDIRYDMILNLE